MTCVTELGGQGAGVGGETAAGGGKHDRGGTDRGDGGGVFWAVRREGDGVLNRSGEAVGRGSLMHACGHEKSASVAILGRVRWETTSSVASAGKRREKGEEEGMSRLSPKRYFFLFLFLFLVSLLSFSIPFNSLSI